MHQQDNPIYFVVRSQLACMLHARTMQIYSNAARKIHATCDSSGNILELTTELIHGRNVPSSKNPPTAMER